MEKRGQEKSSPSDITLRNMSNVDDQEPLDIEIGGRAHDLDQLRDIIEMDFPFAEISLYDPSEMKGMLHTLMRLKGDHGIRYLAHGPNEGNPWNTRALRNVFLPKIQALIGLAAELEAPLFTIHFWLDVRFIKKEVLSEKFEILGEICDEARKRCVSLCIENLSEGPEDLSPIFLIYPDLCMTLDVGHGQILSSKNRAFDFIERFPERIRHIHVHDNRGGNRVKDDLHLSVGEGIIDFQSILGAFIRIPYQGTMTLEVPIEKMDVSRRRILEMFEGLKKA